jgi:hypothetical protein
MELIDGHREGVVGFCCIDRQGHDGDDESAERRVCQFCRDTQGPTITLFLQRLIQLLIHDTIPTDTVLKRRP